jgi:hypothetical protein
MNRHFFQEAAYLSWPSWLFRKVFGNSQAPSLLESDLDKNPLPPLPKGIQQQRAKPEYAKEYSLFLETYFYESSASVKLKIPEYILIKGLTERSLVGVEARDSQNRLVGCVFNQYAGLLNINGKEVPTGLVTWLCVSPTWRKTGLASCLLFFLYAYSQPRKIHWWKNDGWIRSPLPPIHTLTMYMRNKQLNRVQMAAVYKKAICRPVPLASWRQEFINQWKTRNESGIVLDDLNPSSPSSTLFKVYECIVSTKSSAAILLQPTFEVKTGQMQGCEIIGWAWKGYIPSHYEQAHFLETMLDQLPYMWFEAPFEFPRLDHLWTYSHKTSWSCIGLDPGIPCERPVYPLLAA